MKQEVGLPSRTRLTSSEEEDDEVDVVRPVSPVYGVQDHDDGPMDLRKKPSKDEDRQTPPSAPSDHMLDIWQRALFTGIHPYLSLILGSSSLGDESHKVRSDFPYGISDQRFDLLTPTTPVICDQFGVRHAVFKTPEGDVATVPLSGLLEPALKDLRESRVPTRIPNSELLSRLQSAPFFRTGYNGAPLREDCEPEDLTVSRRRDSEDSEDDLRRSRSCSDIPRYPDPEMLERVRVKSDSESPVSWSTPISRLTTPAKRKIEEPVRSETAILNSPITRLLDPKRQEKNKLVRLERQDLSERTPPSEQDSFLRKLRQQAHVPWNVYSYYTQMMQSLSTKDHEVLRGHLTSSVPPPASITNPGILSPSPTSTPLSASPPSANGDSRKNVRVLTGKHVRHGTGASPSTLLTLKQKIQERQKAKEHACAPTCAQQDTKHKELARKRTASKVRLVKQ